MAIVGAVMIILGLVAICLGFYRDYPNAHESGALFFVGGWLLIALDRVAWGLEKIRRVISQNMSADSDEITIPGSGAKSRSEPADAEA